MFITFIMLYSSSIPPPPKKNNNILTRELIAHTQKQKPTPGVLSPWPYSQMLETTSAFFEMEDEGTCWYTNCVCTRFLLLDAHGGSHNAYLIVLPRFSGFSDRPVARETGDYTGAKDFSLRCDRFHARMGFYMLTFAAMLTPFLTGMCSNTSVLWGRKVQFCSYSFKIKFAQMFLFIFIYSTLIMTCLKIKHVIINVL